MPVNFEVNCNPKIHLFIVSIAATAIYVYAWLVPLALWGFLMWRNNKVVNIVSYSFLEIVCVYGYSLFIYIPTAVSIVQFSILGRTGDDVWKAK